MPRDEDHAVEVPLGYDLKIKPTDEKLKQDAASLCAQYIQYWLPGEVEITVILARPNTRDPVYATTITDHERLKAVLRKASDHSAIQALLVRGNKGQR